MGSYIGGGRGRGMKGEMGCYEVRLSYMWGRIVGKGLLQEGFV